MPVTTQDLLKEYTANGITTAFAYPFRVINSDQILVYVDDELVEEDYVVTGVGQAGGGTITFDVAPTSSSVITFVRTSPVEREYDYTEGGGLTAETLDDDQDYQTMILQEVVDRTFQLDPLTNVYDLDGAIVRNVGYPEEGTDFATVDYVDALLAGEDTPLDSIRGDLATTTGTTKGFNLVFIPRTATEVSASVTPTNYQFAECDPRRYGGDPTGSADSTTALQAAINVASLHDYGQVNLNNGTFKTGTLKIDANNMSIVGPGRLNASTNIPAGGGIFVSLAAGSDATTNQALLDSAYGASVQTVRSSVTTSLTNVKFINVYFNGRVGTAISAIWFTGFTRGCAVVGCTFVNFEHYAIKINGSWSFALDRNFLTGNNTGTGIGLGITGNGTRGGSSVCNAVAMTGNEVTAFSVGCTWNFGSGGSISANTFETNTSRGLSSQSTSGIACVGNYFENNGTNNTALNANIMLGGTNGSDFCVAWAVTGNTLSASSSAGQNIILRGMQSCIVGSNSFSGNRTQLYYITTGVGQYITSCEFEAPNITSTYVTNADAEINACANKWHNGARNKYRNNQNSNYTFTLQDGSRVTSKLSGGNGETWTLDSTVTDSMPLETVLEGVNIGGGTLTIAVGGGSPLDTLRLAGGTTTGSRTIANGGWFRMQKVDDTVWLIEGLGVT